jgi:hypothetical protein
MSGELRECGDACNELLPWYLNGTLESDERARVEAHLEACPICHRELEALSELSRALSLLPENAAESMQPAPKSGKAPVPAPLGWAIAASVVLLSLLGLVAYLNQAREAPPSATPAAETVALDLGSGPIRSTGSPVELRLAVTTRSVELSFLPPINGTNDYEIRTFGPDQAEIRSWDRGPLALDGLGRARVSIEASRFSRAGEHHLLVRHFGPAGELREYSFPFTVASLPPR